ncbi:hypothetical protein FCE95_08035 [Luteimonas gilva]|uniref:Uncharacterized protein n=1 Tax=Luteimonas gilva TaxID=2572684 RepID=A0A4U5JKV3_9GAMM|nr:hypothetical protein [Luteimonas gilva]TKR30084.1 hypothetical protein FCE95_08035 [Luteimonas gilva]
MSKTPLVLALLTLIGPLTATIPDASAQGRVRGHAVVHGVDGGRAAATRAAGRGERGAYVRGRNVLSDGQGNAAGRSGAYAVGADGGTAQRQGSFYRNADGSAGRQGSASIDGAKGGGLNTSGSIARNANGDVSGSRSTSATGANGNTYNGSTTVQNGVVTHTRACTNAAGEAIACRGR